MGDPSQGTLGPADQAHTLREFDGHSIRQRNSDGYFDATELCRVGGKQFKHWKESATAKEYLAALSTKSGIPTTELVVSRKGGNPKMQGTWIHPLAAMRLAQWVNVKFAILVDTWVLDLAEGKSSGFGKRPAAVEFEELDEAAADRMELIADEIRNREQTRRQLHESEMRLNQLCNGVQPGNGVYYDPFIQ